MKENEKILISKSILKVTFIMMGISLFLKLLGLNVMEAETSSNVLMWLTNLFKGNKYLDLLYLFIFLFVQAFIFLKLSCKSEKNKIYYISSILITIITLFIQWILYITKYNSVQLYAVFSFLVLIIPAILIDIKMKISNVNNNQLIKIIYRLKQPIIIFILSTIYQAIVLFLRNITYIQIYDRLYNFLLNFDYIILLLFTYYLFSKRNKDIKISSMFEFKLPKIFNKVPSIDDIKSIIINFKEKKEKFKIMNKSEKLVIIIYIILFIISELFNLFLVIFIACINNVLIECLFIISSFLITRNTFGSFHFDAAWKCWIVSNISFFILDKLTLSVGFTIIIPIICGISLAFITSKFIKKTITSPYRGMNRNELDELCKDKNLSKFEKELLIDFYCNRESIAKLTYKYNYSQTAIVRFKKIAMNKIRN